MAQVGSVGIYPPMYPPLYPAAHPAVYPMYPMIQQVSSGNAPDLLTHGYPADVKGLPMPMPPIIYQPVAMDTYSASSPVAMPAPPPYSPFPEETPLTPPPPYSASPVASTAQQGVYGGIQNHGVQQYLPIAEKRSLDPQEDADIQKGLRRWWPKIGAGYATPMHELLANPYKSAMISALLLGALAGAAGLLFLQPKRAFALAGLALGSFIGAFSGYINRRQQNENILDLMHRFPQGATKRDMLSDPVYQADLNRVAMAHSSGGNGGDLLTGAILGSAFSTAYGNRRS